MVIDRNHENKLNMRNKIVTYYTQDDELRSVQLESNEVPKSKNAFRILH